MIQRRKRNKVECNNSNNNTGGSGDDCCGDDCFDNDLSVIFNGLLLFIINNLYTIFIL